MPNFTSPFVGNVPERKMTLRELVRALRMNLSAEEDATSLYEAHEKVAAGQDLADTPIYVCGFCGHTGRGEVPEKCPVCGAKREMFQVF